MKTCSKCHETKAKSEFRKDKQKKDGLYSQCKTCRKTYEKQHYSTHKKVIQYKRKLAYNDEAKSKKAQYDKKYREVKGEERLKDKRDYYHSRGGKEIGNRWRFENPLKSKSYLKRERIERQRVKDKSSITSKQMYNWFLEQTYLCSYCGKSCSGNFHIDHIEPLAKGGLHELDNLTISCPSCNQSKHSKPLLLWYATNRSG